LRFFENPARDEIIIADDIPKAEQNPVRDDIIVSNPFIHIWRYNLYKKGDSDYDFSI